MLQLPRPASPRQVRRVPTEPAARRVRRAWRARRAPVSRSRATASRVDSGWRRCSYPCTSTSWPFLDARVRTGRDRARPAAQHEERGLHFGRGAAPRAPRRPPRVRPVVEREREQPADTTHGTARLRRRLVGVAQLVELRVVVPAAAGSSPVAHPSRSPCKRGFPLRSGPVGPPPRGQIGDRFTCSYRRRQFGEGGDEPPIRFRGDELDLYGEFHFELVKTLSRSVRATRETSRMRVGTRGWSSSSTSPTVSGVAGVGGCSGSLNGRRGG